MMPHVDTEVMQEFLDRHTKTRADDERAAMFADQAEWHIAKTSRHPTTSRSCRCPPTAPRSIPSSACGSTSRSASSSLDDYEVIVDGACAAWNRVVANTDRIKSLCTYPWIQAIIP